MENDFRAYQPEEMDLILVKTTDAGPYAEDCFYLMFKGEQYWEVPNSAADGIFSWLGSSEKVDWSQSILASTSTENAVFVLWRKDGPPVFSAERRLTLERRLQTFFSTNFKIDDAKAIDLQKNIFERYYENHRRYHTMDHISHCLWELDRLESATLHKAEIELALWYHDAIYEIRSKTNEEDSAKLLIEVLAPFETKLNLETVKDLILASKHLGGTPAKQSPEIDAFLDIDLSILGRTPIDYEVYKRQIRDEYRSVGNLLYAYGRKKVLRHFLSQTLFRTEGFRSRYEEQAKKNLAEEITNYRLIPFV